MRDWTPATQTVDPLQAAINDLARHMLMPALVGTQLTRLADGWRGTLQDGRAISISLELVLRSDRYWHSRAVIAYDMLGHATADHEGFTFDGQVIVDAATRGFLHVDCQLRSMRHLS